MFKKLISGALSAAIIVTSAASSNFFGTADISKKTSPNSDPCNIDYDLQATNSLGKYLKSMADKNNNDLNPEKMSNKTDSSFAMNSLDFKIDTGMITAFSTQSEKCYMRFSFINEDTNETAAAYKCEVDAGQCTMTEKKVDTKELPQYFLLTAELVDKNDKVISETYHVDKYTKIMQEIAETDIHDFDEDRVVNFDENEDTNFIVLSDDTVIAESSDTENSLVSADFDNNTFVFEHIDESIQYLQNGDFLYVQPDEENIIAVSVDNVDIDGDTATVTGSDDIDDMLAFIKFETTGNMEGAEIDTSDSDFVFPGHEDETKFTMDEDKPVEFMYNSRKPIGITLNGEASLTIPIDIHKGAEEDYGKDGDFTIKGSFTGRIKFNFCKKWAYTSLSFSINPEFSLALVLEGKKNGSAPFVGDKVEKSAKIQELAKSYENKNQKWTEKLLDITLPTPVPGIDVNTSITFGIEVSGEVNISFNYSPEFGFKGDTKKGFHFFSETGKDVTEVGLNIKGSILFGLIIEPELQAISDKIASAGMEFTAGLVINAEMSDHSFLDAQFDTPKDQLQRSDDYSDQFKLSSDHKVAIVNSDADYLHTCDLCFKGTVGFEIKLNFKLKLLGKHISPEADIFDVTLEFPSLDFYFGIPDLDTDKFDFGWRKHYNIDSDEKTCPHYKYRTMFNVTDEFGVPLKDVKITINGVENITDENGFTQFYCDNGMYTYKVHFNGKIANADLISIERKANSIPLVVKKVLNDNDEFIGISIYNFTKETTITTTTTATTTTAPVSTTTTAFVENKNDEILEAKQLGDNVWGMIYPDGFMLIIGHGDMYSNLPTYVFENIGIVKQVVFEDDDPENGQYITSIGNNLFMNAEKLEYVYLSNEISKINDRAFANCEKLKCFRYGGENDKTETFVLPSKLKYIGTEAFFGCESAAFGDLVFNENAREIGTSAFYGCKKITSVTIPETVTKIEPTVFKMCSNITNAVIKADIDEMGAGLFYGCPLLEDLVLPKFSSYYYYHPTFHTKSDGEAKIDKLFDNCENSYATDVPKGLKKITVLSGKEIPDQYFMHMAYIDKYALPEGITKIGSQAFYDNSSLTKIICIDENKDLSFLELFKDVEEFGDSAFFKDEKLEIGDLVFNNNVKSIGTSAFLFCPNVTSVVIPESVESIGPTAFYGCSEIKTAVIKTNIDEMGAGLFYDCNQMQELTIQGFPTYYYSIGTRMFYDTSVSMLFYNCSNNYRTYVPPTLKKVNIMSGTEMPENALDSFIDLKILSLPNELKLVGKHATHDMTSLEEVIYNGTEEEWNEIDIKEQNDPLLKKIITFAPVEETEWVTGDANGDGELDMSDIVLIMQALANPDKFGVDGYDPTHITANGFKYADTNGDGLTVSDAANIQKFLLGLSDSVSA